jgi:hypothetical protein
VISSDENNEQEIITDRQEKKGGIQYPKEDKSESAKMKEKREKVAD